MNVHGVLNLNCHGLALSDWAMLTIGLHLHVQKVLALGQLQVGAVAVWVGGAYGHVALVTAAGKFYKHSSLKSNYMGHHYIGNHRGWFNPTDNF